MDNEQIPQPNPNQEPLPQPPFGASQQPSSPTNYTNQEVSQFPSRPPRKTRFIVAAIVIVVFLAIMGAVIFFMINRNSSKKSSSQAQGSNQAKENKSPASVQDAVNKYCQQLGKAYGMSDMTTGYIISERYSEEILSDSPQLLRFKQIGNAAVATVDCERSGEGQGISNDLLFINTGGTWGYVDEVQNSTRSGFSCKILDQYSVSKELVSKCSQEMGGTEEPR